MSGETSHDKGKVEGLLKKSLFILGGIAVAALLLPPVGAAVGKSLTGLTGRVGK